MSEHIFVITETRWRRRVVRNFSKKHYAHDLINWVKRSIMHTTRSDYISRQIYFVVHNAHVTKILKDHTVATRLGPTSFSCFSWSHNFWRNNKEMKPNEMKWKQKIIWTKHTVDAISNSNWLNHLIHGAICLCSIRFKWKKIIPWDASNAAPVCMLVCLFVCLLCSLFALEVSI